VNCRAQSKEGLGVAADRGTVVTLDATITDALTLEGDARELVHFIQNLRKDAGLEITDTITLSLTGADAILKAHEALILDETRAELGTIKKGESSEITLSGTAIGVRFAKK
jgi:isoleucyl-tRNA synthetase